jgi:hypothetical protein
MNEESFKLHMKPFISDEYHDELIEPFMLEYMFRQAILAAQRVNMVKKSLFYGARFRGKKYEYLKTKIEHNDKLNHILHAVLGLFTESGEMLEILYDIMSKRSDPDFYHFTEELGDFYWYLTLLQMRLNLDPNEIRRKNALKNHARFGTKFSENRALFRDLKKEHKAMEK